MQHYSPSIIFNDFKYLLYMLFLLTLDVLRVYKSEITICFSVVLLFELYPLGIWSILHFYLGLIMGKKGMFLAMFLLNVYIIYYKDFYTNKFGKYNIWH